MDMRNVEYLIIAVFYAAACGLFNLGTISNDMFIMGSGIGLFILALVCTWIQLTDD